MAVLRAVGAMLNVRLARFRRVFAAVLGIAGVVSACSRVDPAPPDVLVGASVRDGGAVDLRIVKCTGGTLRTLGVSQVESDNSRTPLWKAEADASVARRSNDTRVVRVC